MLENVKIWHFSCFCWNPMSYVKASTLSNFFKKLFPRVPTCFLSSLLSKLKCNNGKFQSCITQSFLFFLVLILKVVYLRVCVCVRVRMSVFCTWHKSWVKISESLLIFFGKSVYLFLLGYYNKSFSLWFVALYLF